MDSAPTAAELARRLADYREALKSLSERIDRLSDTDREVGLLIGGVIKDLSHLGDDVEDLEREWYEMKRAATVARRWAIPVAISIATLLVMIISQTVPLVFR